VNFCLQSKNRLEYNKNMLDIKFIRENLELCKKAAVNKNRIVEWEKLLAADEKRRELIAASDTIRKERNVSGGNTDEARVKGKELKEKLKVVEDELRDVDANFTSLLLTVPNVPHESVPIGKDSSGNVEIKTWGKQPSFTFPVKDHIDLARSLDVIDFDRGTKVSGFRGYFLKNEGALLEMGILMYMMQKLVKKGYTSIMAPVLLKEFTLFGIGQFPWGRQEVYNLEKDDLYLAGTAEQPVTSYYSDEVLEEKDLPKKFVAFSPCFRREAGSYGKDTKGIYRVHQFNKIEQVIISKNDLSTSVTLHEELLQNAEELLQDLEIPYRVLLMCTGDMGEPQVKKYDIEAWIPSKGAYGEMMSDSIMGDFQARRLKIRYRGKDGKVQFCHTLNNTAVASPRILIPILENYQQKDGSVKVPEVLQPYVGTDVIPVRIK
jgi:seryl-tRNA synthetase